MATELVVPTVVVGDDGFGPVEPAGASSGRRRLGVDLLQGYPFAEPIPVSALRATLLRSIAAEQVHFRRPQTPGRVFAFQ